MHFAPHYDLVGKHATLSPSSYHWIHYDTDKFDSWLYTRAAAQRGTELHKLAHDLIRLGVLLPDTTATLNRYVNDAIRFRMTPEQILSYSRNCFGTADALSFHDNVLRIHDLKTGVIPAHVEQLEVYAAIFCLEYNFTPMDIQIAMRIYQNDEVIEFDDPDLGQIMQIMDKIKYFDKMMDKFRLEA